MNFVHKMYECGMLCYNNEAYIDTFTDTLCLSMPSLILMLILFSKSVFMHSLYMEICWKNIKLTTLWYCTMSAARVLHFNPFH